MTRKNWPCEASSAWWLALTLSSGCYSWKLGMVVSLPLPSQIGSVWFLILQVTASSSNCGSRRIWLIWPRTLMFTIAAKEAGTEGIWHSQLHSGRQDLPHKVRVFPNTAWRDKQQQWTKRASSWKTLGPQKWIRHDHWLNLMEVTVLSVSNTRG